MKKHLHFLSFLILGFLLISNASIACDIKTEKSCCKIETSIKKEMKDCCKKTQDNEKSKPCDGKCGHTNCTTSVSSFSFILNNEIKFSSNTFVISTEKQKFYLSETPTSNGFFSLWLIPKIG